MKSLPQNPLKSSKESLTDFEDSDSFTSALDVSVSDTTFLPETPSEQGDPDNLRDYSASPGSYKTILSGLSDVDLEQVDDLMIERYLRACHGDTKLAIKRIKATLAWRIKERPHDMVCSACLDVGCSNNSAAAHHMHVVGHDFQNRPVIYSCLAVATNRNVEDNKVHMLATFEQAIRFMAPGVEAWVWVMDFHGFGMRDCDPRLAKIFLSVAEAHYPERLGKFFIVGAPAIFSTLWKAIYRFIDPITRAKIHFCNFDYKPDKRDSPGKLVPLLKEHFPPETTAWLLTEMKENRVKSHVRTKRYSYQSFAKVVSMGHDHDEVEKEMEERKQSSLDGAHDLLGTRQHLEYVSGKKHLLIPGLAAHINYL